MFLALAIRSALPATDPRPIGVVDQVQLLPGTQASSSGPVEVLFFSSVPAASLALASGKIQAYYHIQPDYWDNGEIVVTYNVAPVEQIDRMFTDWVGSRVRTQPTS